jgi:hypothetical protein
LVPLASDGPLRNDVGMSALTVHLAIRKTLAVITVGRDHESLRAEVAMEREAHARAGS